jgi:hypothetical protein
MKTPYTQIQPHQMLVKQINNNKVKFPYKYKLRIKKKRTRAELRKKVLLRKSRDIRFKSILNVYNNISEDFISLPL